MKKAMLILVLLLVMLPLTGCLDELMFMEEDFEALEVRTEAIEDRIYRIMDLLTYEGEMVFEQRMDTALAGLEKDFEARMETIFEGVANLDELEVMSETELMGLLENMDLTLIVDMLNEMLDEVMYAMDEAEHDILPHRQTIRLYVDQGEARLNGRTTSLDQPPIIMEGRTLVPLRFIGEALGANINWDGANRQVIYRLNGNTIQLTIDSREVLVNDRAAQLEVAPMILNDRTLVPARFVSETLGFDVEWDGAKRMVVINTPYDVGMDSWDDWNEPEIPPAVSYRMGVVVGAEMLDDTPMITLLVDGNEIHYKANEYLFWEVESRMDFYADWGLFQAGFAQDMTLVSLEYTEGVEDYFSVIADYYSDKTLADVLEVENLTVTFVGVEYMMSSDDPDEFHLTPANGETIQLAEDVVVYAKGEDGLFKVGEVSNIQENVYDYAEFYDIDGDLVYDIVIVWLI